MGRQASAVVCALGRSPYERPNPTEAQEYVTRQAAWVREHSGLYIQLYDERGHPQNPTIKSSSKQMRKAQNDVLYSVGVVGKNENRKRLNDVTEENGNGLLAAAFDSVSTVLSACWIDSLRVRYQTFETYSFFPLTRIIQTERNRLGFLSFHFAGLPYWVVGSLLDNRHSRLVQGAVEVIKMYQPVFARNQEQQDRLRQYVEAFCQIGDYVFFTFAVPFQLFAVLQALQIIPSDALIPLRAFIPFHPESLFGFPPLPTSAAIPDFVKYSYSLLTSPFVFALAYEAVQNQIQGLLFRCIRQIVPKPENPDQVSMQAAIDSELDPSDIPGLSQLDSTRTNEITRAIFDDVRKQHIEIVQWFQRLRNRWSTRIQSRTDPAPMDEAEISQSGGSPVSRTSTLQAHISSTRNESRTGQPRGSSIDIHLGSVLYASAPDDERAGRPSAPPLNVTANSSGMNSRADMVPTVDNPSHALEPAPATTDRDRLEAVNLLLASPSANELGQSRSRVHFTSLDGSPLSTPPTSPTLRASLLQRDTGWVTLQLEITPSNPRRSPLQDLSDMYFQARSTIILLGRTRHQLLSYNGFTSNNLNHAIDHIDQVTRWIHLYERGVFSGAPPEHLQEILTNFADQRNLFAAIARNAVEDAVFYTASEGNGPPEITTMTEVEVQRFESEIAEYLRPLSHIPRMAQPVSTETTMEPEPDSDTALDRLESIFAAPPIQIPQNTTTSLTPAHEDLDVRPSTADTLPFQHNVGNPHHRVTTLSNYPADALASHITTVLTSAFLLPLQSLYLRSIASYYLSRAPSFSTINSPMLNHLTTQNSHGILVPIVRPLGSWLGLNSISATTRTSSSHWNTMFNYSSTLLLLLGLEQLTLHCVWRVATALIVRFGKDVCGWGKL